MSHRGESSRTGHAGNSPAGVGARGAETSVHAAGSSRGDEAPSGRAPDVATARGNARLASTKLSIRDTSYVPASSNTYAPASSCGAVAFWVRLLPVVEPVGRVATRLTYGSAPGYGGRKAEPAVGSFCTGGTCVFRRAPSPSGYRNHGKRPPPWLGVAFRWVVVHADPSV